MTELFAKIDAEVTAVVTASMVARRLIATRPDLPVRSMSLSLGITGAHLSVMVDDDHHVLAWSGEIGAGELTRESRPTVTDMVHHSVRATGVIDGITVDVWAGRITAATGGEGQ
ncbi:hypothetical protein [Streptomyces bohaiensis]|uniref:hypothetical protein n=1 Tax=Streptomyces bohaiensis TaxID=1431344 RepID=UPI003B79724F